MGSVEHVGGGGEIRLNRDRFVQNADGTSIGTFTLEGLKDFVMEAELADVHPKQGLWFRFVSGSPRRVKHMYFPTEGHVDYSEPEEVVPGNFTGYQVFAILVIGLIFGLLIGGILFGG